MHLAQWTTRLLSQPLTQATRFSVGTLAHSTRYFSSGYWLLDTAHQDSEKLEARRKYLREWQNKRFRESEAYREVKLTNARRRYQEKYSKDPAWLEASRAYKKEYYSRTYHNIPWVKGRMRFRAWVCWSFTCPCLFE